MIRRIITFICIIGMLSGLGLIAYPTVSNIWNEYRNEQIAASYNQVAGEYSDELLQKMMDDAVAYNEEHKKTGNYVKDAFNDSEEYILTHPYDTLLNLRGDEVMGYIEIPAIKARIAIYHGIGTEALTKGCGHVEGTRLPVGGENTHAVLAAHRGLPSAKLFTDLDQMKEGDVFYIHVLNQTLAYEVDQIKVVLPEDISDLLIDKNEDYVTLVTCTPYGINSHRLLVRGTRIPYEEAQAKAPSQTKGWDPMWGAYIAAAVAAAAILAWAGSRQKKQMKPGGEHEEYAEPYIFRGPAHARPPDL